jgi:antibiotic biosynthesis monooxygenase (ABM) superfamily enzyme
MWKTASLVLLTLLPVVMLEIRFLKPHLRTLNPAVGTFIVDAITVVLTTAADASRHLRSTQRTSW